MKERIVYECEHCSKKRYLSKYKTRDHESICWYNPKVKACNSCNHNYYNVVRICELGIKTDLIPIIHCNKWEPKKEWEEQDERNADF